MPAGAPAPVRPLTVLAVGGTISMASGPGGGGVVPALDAEALAVGVPGLHGRADVEIRTLRQVPGAHLSPADALAVAREATRAAAGGRGVVVTSGTDTLEELAVLCDALWDPAPPAAPVVLTGAIRPATAPGADGPANLADAVAVAGSADAAGLGAVVVFAGEVHAARTVRKVDATSPRAFGSPSTGPIGHAAEGRAVIAARPSARGPRLDPERLDFEVPIVTAVLGDDGTTLRRLAAHGPHGLVLTALGAGHLSPGSLEALGEACAAGIRVAVCSRPQRGVLLHRTYAFRGAEADVRATGALPAGALSPEAARVLLLACLGAGADSETTAQVLGVPAP